MERVFFPCTLETESSELSSATMPRKSGNFENHGGLDQIPFFLSKMREKRPIGKDM